MGRRELDSSTFLFVGKLHIFCFDIIIFSFFAHRIVCLFCVIVFKKSLFYRLIQSFYSAQLQRLRQVIIEKRQFTGTVLFQHDNARPHTAGVVKSKIAEYGWELVPHPPYSPDLAPSDYHLFRPMKNWMRAKEYDDEQELITDLNAYFASKDQAFFERGIHSLPDKWQLTINYEGDYFVDE